MLITQKHKYALRSIFELAKRHRKKPIKLSEIAEAQAIPPRFLEVIMVQLKSAGFVTSKRGRFGGYALVKTPDQISVGDIFRSLDTGSRRDRCDACIAKEGCPFHGSCAFMPMWDQVCRAIYDVFDQTTIQDLLNNEKLAVQLT